MSDRIKTAIVGCGGIVSARMSGYRTIWEKGFKYYDLVAMCDIAEERAQKRADEGAEFQGDRPRIYTDFRELLDKEPDLELIDIATDHRSHHTIAVPCLDAGKDVIIAKPLGLSMRSCKVMVEAAQRNGKLLAVAENARRSSAERAINWAIRTGRIGEPRMLFWHDIAERLGTWAWRDFRLEAGGGWVLDGGVHFADLFRYHLGDADEVYAVSKQFEPVRYKNPQTREGAVDVTVEDTTMAIVKFKSGAIVQWNDCRVAREKQYGQRRLYGSEGCIDWQVKQARPAGHNLDIGDIDGDGVQEVICGGVCYNSDGTVRWEAEPFGHTDISKPAMIDPDREGLQVWYAVESNNPGIYLVDKDGRTIFKEAFRHAHYGWIARHTVKVPGLQPPMESAKMSIDYLKSRGMV